MNGLDPNDIAAVRGYVECGKSKPTPEERQAFNEGVIAASLVLGAYIDAQQGLDRRAIQVLEAAYRAILGVKQRWLAP